MKKLIALAVTLLFLGVTGIAAAADITMSGDYSVQGTYQKNAEDVDGMQEIDEAGTQYYDHEFNLNATWNIDDNTSIITQFEMRDEVWGQSVKEDTVFDASDSTMDDNIIVEKVYLWHKFANGHQLRVGLIPANPWGTVFGDEASEAYRIRYDIPTNGYGTLIGVIQKGKEATDNVYDGTAKVAGKTESDDEDAYYLLYTRNLGDININPGFKYADNGNDSTALVGILGIDGKFGNIGFETEVMTIDTDYEAADTAAKADNRTYGAYLNVWNTSGPVTAGILGAYGSSDSKDSFAFGGDFDGGGAKILGYDYDLEGAVLGALYADYNINDKLSIGGYAGYVKYSREDADAKWDGAKAWELSADAAYKITDNLVYDCGAGVAQLKWGNNLQEDPDKAYRVFHRLTVNF